MLLNFIVFACFAPANAQSAVSNTQISAAEFQTVFIKADTYISIEIITEDRDDVEIDEMRGGEYYDLKSLQTQVRNDTLFIKEQKNILVEKYDDKLAAHKMIDATVKICLPSGKNLRIELAEADLSLSGVFQKIHVNQNSGTSSFSDLRGDLLYRSISADITWSAKNYFLRGITAQGRLDEVTSQPIKSTAVIETIRGKFNLEI